MSSRGGNSLVRTSPERPAAIHEYIAHENPIVADHVIDRLIEAVGRLREFPDSGRPVEELKDSGVREIIAAPYHIAYEVEGETVRIFKVWHGKQLFPL